MEDISEDTPNSTVQNEVADHSNKETASTTPSVEPQKKNKRDDKNRKKDDKIVEQFMRTLNAIPNADEKIEVLCKKYVQSAEDNSKLQFYIKQSDKRHTLLVKEKEHLQHEYNKTILVKSKLENLCRELQKQNKAIKEESLLKIREEEERRKETQAKFQNTLTEITTLLQQNNEKNVKLRDDNISMSEKFKSVVQQYQLREQQVEKMAKQMALESQLADAKLQKCNLEHQAEKERLLAEMEQMKVTIAQFRAKIVEQQGTETALKGQLAVYTDKYDEFQNALVKSNQVFGGFKEQMEMMSKKIKKLEKESLSWKKRWETSQTALLDMCGERQLSEERVTATTRQLQHMQSLCRTLQAERTLLLNTLKEHNIERPPLPAAIPAAPAPTPPPAPAPSPAKDAKMDAMVANCAQLRQSLAHLQTQLNVLTNNKNVAKEEPPKTEKQKKTKSKKSKADKQAQKTDFDKCELKDKVLDEPNEEQEGACAIEANSDNTGGQNQTENTEEMDQDKGDDEAFGDTIDEKTLDSLRQTIKMANITLYEVDGKIEIVRDLNLAVEENKAGDIVVPQLEDDKADNDATDAVKTSDQTAGTNQNEEIAHIAEIKPIVIGEKEA